MNIRKKALLSVPMYCLGTGILAFNLVIAILSNFGTVVLPDGTMEIRSGLRLFLNGAVFLIVLLVGGLVFFRKLTRWEVFLSAAIAAGFQLLVLLAQLCLPAQTAPFFFDFAYLSMLLGQWSMVFTTLLLEINCPAWACGIVKALSPFLFVLFKLKKAQ